MHFTHCNSDQRIMLVVLLVKFSHENAGFLAKRFRLGILPGVKKLIRRGREERGEPPWV